MKAIVNLILISIVLLFATGYRFSSHYPDRGIGGGHTSGPSVSHFGRHHCHILEHEDVGMMGHIEVK